MCGSTDSGQGKEGTGARSTAHHVKGVASLVENDARDMESDHRTTLEKVRDEIAELKKVKRQKSQKAAKVARFRCRHSIAKCHAPLLFSASLKVADRST